MRHMISVEFHILLKATLVFAALLVPVILISERKHGVAVAAKAGAWALMVVSGSGALVMLIMAGVTYWKLA